MTTSLTPQAKLEALTAAIMEAVPEIANQSCTHKIMDDETGCPFTSHNREITLEDVLRALPNTVSVRNDGHMWCNVLCKDPECIHVHEDDCEWSLGQPLHLQSEATWDFLLSVLKP